MVAGKEGCPCTNEAAALSSLTERSCEVASTGEPGVLFKMGGYCVPISYGSSKCLLHDLHNDPACFVDGDDIIPPYCFRPFCYVDADVCARESNERVYRSDYFNIDSGVDVFYSYSTCNSTCDDWLGAVDGKVEPVNLGQITIKANIPRYVLPMMYKRDPISNEILNVMGSEYYDNSVPYEGVYPSFAEKIMKFSQGDIKNITYTHRSKVSSDLHPTSSFTAAVQDIQDGLVDMSVGPFWITGERLLMSAFTVPIVYDKVFLVIPKPGADEGFMKQVSKVLQPFTYKLWGLVISIIAVSGLLSVWFADRPKARADHWPRLRRKKMRRKKRAYMRLAVDSILEMGTFFCSAGVGLDPGSNLSNKLLMFGFGFFILITVSSYVANLAAFLTRKTLEGSVTSIDGAIARGWKICAHPVFVKDLELAWPNGKFVFSEAGTEFYGVLDDYINGKCKALAIGWEDTSMDRSFLDRLCENELVYTDSMFHETPIAFPIRQGLAAGFSHWMLQAKRNHNLVLQAVKDEFATESACNVHFSAENIETSDYDPIDVEHMALPIILFIVCSSLAIIGHLCERRDMKRGRSSLFAVHSQLQLVVDEPSHIPRALRMGGRISFGKGRRSTTDSSFRSKEDDDDDEMYPGIHGTQTLVMEEQNSGSSNFIYKKDDDVEMPPSIHDLEVEEEDDSFHSIGRPHFQTGRSIGFF
mmetsp:Transcript_36129/g.67048  ORF Transcript_36129/g.67048 Transcript_36129/m.67048 type:complete len:698 (-) Transcript_36129:205-2298(-)